MVQILDFSLSRIIGERAITSFNRQVFGARHVRQIYDAEKRKFELPIFINAWSLPMHESKGGGALCLAYGRLIVCSSMVPGLSSKEYL